MTYIKMNADYVSIDELSRLTSIPGQLIDQLVNKGMQFAYTIVDGYDAPQSFEERKLNFYFFLDELGLGKKIKQALIDLYKDDIVNTNLSFDRVDKLLVQNNVESEIVNMVIDRMASELG